MIAAILLGRGAAAVGNTKVDAGPVTSWLGHTTSLGNTHGDGQNARLNTVSKVVEHPTTHDLYIVEYGNEVIRRVPFGSSTTENWLGTLGAGAGLNTAAGTAARLFHPSTAIITADGVSMYVADALP